MVSRFAKIMPLSAWVAARIWRNENDYSKRWRCPEPVYNYEAVLSNLMLAPATVKPKPIPARKSHGQQLAEAKLLQAWFVAKNFWVPWFVLVLGLGCMALGSHSLHLWVHGRLGTVWYHFVSATWPGEWFLCNENVSFQSQRLKWLRSTKSEVLA